jgi:uncharacterized phosphatase
MIKRLIFVRHGQSEANVAGQRADVQLTPHGRDQAKAAGKLLKRESIDIIFASDLDRAQSTAQIIAAEIDYPKDNIITDARIREINVGDLTGKPDHGFTAFLELAANGQDSTIETPDQVASRLRPLLAELCSSYDEKTVLIVAHAGLGRVLRSMLTQVPIDDLAKLDVANAQPLDLPVDRLTEECK